MREPSRGTRHLQMPSTSPSTSPTVSWYSPGTKITQAISIGLVSVVVLAIWVPSAPSTGLLPWQLNFSTIGLWVGNPLRITISYIALLAGALWPFWVRRHMGTPDPFGSWEGTVAWPFAEGSALVFAFAQISVFLLDGQYVQAGFNGDTVFSLGVAALVMLLEAGRRSYKLASEAFEIAPRGVLTSGGPPGTAPPPPPLSGPLPPAVPASTSSGPVNQSCTACGALWTTGDAFCSNCGTRTASNGAGYT